MRTPHRVSLGISADVLRAVERLTKGLNLALAEVLERAIGKQDRAALDDYTPRALGRVWKAQHFSYWMTTMLHRTDDASDFDEHRQLGELESVVGSEAGSRYLAEAYTGWPA